MYANTVKYMCDHTYTYIYSERRNKIASVDLSEGTTGGERERKH
jgi:hypothetical protein